MDFILEKAKQDQLGPSKPLNNSIRTTKTSTTTTTTTNTNTTATTTASVIDDDGDEDDEDSAFLASLSPEQRMQLESENDVILSQLESTTDQVQRVAQTLGQIGDLHNQVKLDETG